VKFRASGCGDARSAASLGSQCYGAGRLENHGLTQMPVTEPYRPAGRVA
jgi:hypothetical protein